MIQIPQKILRKTAIQPPFLQRPPAIVELWPPPSLQDHPPAAVSPLQPSASPGTQLASSEIHTFTKQTMGFHGNLMGY